MTLHDDLAKLEREMVSDMLETVEWKPLKDNSQVESQPGMPIATHSGILKMFGCEMKVYRLSDGRAVIDAGDFHRFFGDPRPLTPEEKG